MQHIKSPNKFLVFRTLRKDENPEHLILKRPNENKEWEQLVNEHIHHGSSQQHERVLLSFTAELFVALAFGGIISEIAIVDLNSLNPNKILYEKLDKEYLRVQLSSDIARMRSKRSDEVLIGINPTCTTSPVISGKKLPVTIRSVKRTLHPSFMQFDAFIFPSEEDIKKYKIDYLCRLGGSNKRFYKVKINKAIFIAHPARPNVDQERLLFGVENGDDSLRIGEELCCLAIHEFVCFCVYRVSAKNTVPRCAYYQMDLEYEIDSTKRCFHWGLILMESFHQTNMVGKEMEVSDLASRLNLTDVLLGNWNSGGKCKSAKDLLNEIIYARLASNEKRLVRVSVDRALGCCYPEDHKFRMNF